MADYQVDLVDINNSVIVPGMEFESLEYSRAFNTIGAMSITIPPFYNTALFDRDSLLRIYRTAEGGGPVLEPAAVWFVRSKTIDLETGSISLSCVDQMDLLRRRVVAYRSETLLANKTFEEGNGPAPADDLMKAYVRENMGPDCLTDYLGAYEPARDLEPYLVVEDDESLGPNVEEAASFKTVFDALKSLENSSKAAGNEVFFDVIARPNGTFTFRTLLGELGANRQTNVGGVLFSPEEGNLTRPSLTWDWSEEVTFVYAGVGGHGLVHDIKKHAGSAADATPWNRIETFTNEEELNEDAIEDIANGILAAATPKIRISADTVDTPTLRYGIHYFYGDSVYVQAAGYLFLCHIRSVRNRIQTGRESLSVNLVGELPAVSA